MSKDKISFAGQLKRQDSLSAEINYESGQLTRHPRLSDSSQGNSRFQKRYTHLEEAHKAGSRVGGNQLTSMTSQNARCTVESNEL